MAHSTLSGSHMQFANPIATDRTICATHVAPLLEEPKMYAEYKIGSSRRDAKNVPFFAEAA